MPSTTVMEIESQIASLSPADQLRLLEDLACRLRTRLAGTAHSEHDSFGSELAVRARDRSIQTELSAIDREFQATESDGLTRD